MAARTGTTPAMNAKILLAAIVAATLLATLLGSEGAARATPDFPAAADQDLMLPSGWVESKVDPPDGCHLCHVNESGGMPLTAFGTLMQDDGAVAYEATSTAGPALKAIESADPRAIADIEKGVDPNTDPTALTADPVPEYGCTTASPRAPSGAAGIVLFAALALAFRLVPRSRAFRFDR